MISLLCNLALAGDTGTVGYGPKGFTISDAGGNNFVNFGLNLQPRLTTTINGDPDASDAEVFSDTGLRLRRVLFNVGGTLVGRIDYRFRLDLAKVAFVVDTSGKEQTVDRGVLDDAQIIFRIATPFAVSVGQWKVPYTATQITSDHHLLFPERAMPVEGFKYRDLKITGFGRSRDAGVAVSGSMADKKLDYAAGVFNGNGTNVWPAADFGPMLLFRLNATPLGEMKYDDADLTRGKLRVGLGTGVTTNFNPVYDDQGAKVGDQQDFRLNTELRLAVRGLSLQSELLYGQVFEAEGEDPAPWLGAYAQVGYVIPVGLAPAIRWSRLDPSLEEDGDGVTQVEAALSWFLPGVQKVHMGHQAKLTAGWTTSLLDDADHPISHTAVLSSIVSF